MHILLVLFLTLFLASPVYAGLADDLNAAREDVSEARDALAEARDDLASAQELLEGAIAARDNAQRDLDVARESGAPNREIRRLREIRDEAVTAVSLARTDRDTKQTTVDDARDDLRAAEDALTAVFDKADETEQTVDDLARGCARFQNEDGEWYTRSDDTHCAPMHALFAEDCINKSEWREYKGLKMTAQGSSIADLTLVGPVLKASQRIPVGYTSDGEVQWILPVAGKNTAAIGDLGELQFPFERWVYTEDHILHLLFAQGDRRTSNRDEQDIFHVEYNVTTEAVTVGAEKVTEYDLTGTLYWMAQNFTNIVTNTVIHAPPLCD